MDPPYLAHIKQATRLATRAVEADTAKDEVYAVQCYEACCRELFEAIQAHPKPQSEDANAIRARLKDYLARAEAIVDSSDAPGLAVQKKKRQELLKAKQVK